MVIRVIGRAFGAKVLAERPESEAHYVVDDDGPGRELDPSKSTNKFEDRHVQEPSRWIRGVSPECRPRPGEGEQQDLRFLVGERLDHRRPYIFEYRWEIGGANGGAMGALGVRLG